MTEATKSDRGPRARRRDLRLAASREAILDVAERLFSRQGFHATTLKEIADEAEFSIPTVYAFFAGKEDLFRKVIFRGASRFMDEWRAQLSDADSPLDQLHALIDFSLAYYQAHSDFGRLLLMNWSPATLSSERQVETIIEPAFSESLAWIAGTFDRGQRVGVFRAGDPRSLARLYIGVCTTYQGLNPAIATGEGDTEPAIPLSDFHDIVDAMFVRPDR